MLAQSIPDERSVWFDARVDERTQRYYDAHAETLGNAHASIASPLRAYFARTFEPGTRILDVGAGVGRDLASLVSEGYEAYGIEPSAVLRERAVTRFPEIGPRLHDGALPDDLESATRRHGPFAGILCCAVLQHVPRTKLFDSVFALKSALKDRGRVLLSVPIERQGIVNERDEHGRLFNGITPDELELLFERVGFVSIGRWVSDDALGRPGATWAVLALELRHSGSARPIDSIESVLSTREKKVATYKLALIRALCDIALTEHRTASFTIEGQVRVPIHAIAERWIEYYWPIFESETFLPQMNGEREAGRHRLSFAPELEGLIASYRNSGGLSAFVAARRSARIDDVRRTLHDRVKSKLSTAIRSGPVTYAKGGGADPLFGYQDGCVLVAGPLWRELSLMGHWIQDALILRWADLVTRLSSRNVPVEKVLAALLTCTFPERDTDDVRDLYERQSSLECVWTGRKLAPATLAVDHVIPFSLWRNNDLWNLLPAHQKVNGEKSDRLPTRNLLRARREPILHCWSTSRDAFPTRFALEARAQTGSSSPDLETLFEAFVESVETTALQRACARWNPKPI